MACFVCATWVVEQAIITLKGYHGSAIMLITQIVEALENNDITR